MHPLVQNSKVFCISFTSEFGDLLYCLVLKAGIVESLVLALSGGLGSGFLSWSALPKICLSPSLSSLPLILFVNEVCWLEGVGGGSIECFSHIQ